MPSCWSPWQSLFAFELLCRLESCKHSPQRVSLLLIIFHFHRAVPANWFYADIVVMPGWGIFGFIIAAVVSLVFVLLSVSLTIILDADTCDDPLPSRGIFLCASDKNRVAPKLMLCRCMTKSSQSKTLLSNLAFVCCLPAIHTYLSVMPLCLDCKFIDPK